MEADIEGLDSQRLNGKDLPLSTAPPEPQMQRFNSDQVEVRLKQLQEKRENTNDIFVNRINEPLASGTQQFRSPLFEGQNSDLKDVASNSLSQSTDQTPLAGQTEGAINDTPQMKEKLIQDIMNKK